MPKKQENYFRYFASSPEMHSWGLMVTASGFTHIPAKTNYPPEGHPKDHFFDWERGRVLNALHLVMISKGAGFFETRQTGLCKIKGGMAFVLLPGMWHRYRPDPETGWEESWVEMRGPVVDQLVKRKVFSPEDPLRAGVMGCGMEEALSRIHVSVRQGTPGFDPDRAAAAYAVMASWEKAGRHGLRRTRLERAAEEAESFLASHYQDEVDIRDLALRLGVAYSHFRAAFKRHTGFAPWQYVLHLRLTHACRVLASTDATLDEIAMELGFNSSFHLSAIFKRHYGISPKAWRKNLLG